MKKISFGSFPLTEVRKEDRKCLDRYLIKTFSDNISISDAIRNLSITKNLMYVTPDSLMKSWLTGDKNAQDITVAADRASNSIYDQVLKRAFYILKEFYSRIKNAPFYKEYVYYPIYVEKIEKLTPVGNPNSTDQYTDALMNYSFIILSNDLTKSLKIDEIRYDENASLNFLFIFIEFFSGPDFQNSIHDFDQKDYEFLIKLYQFIEKSGKEPIRLILDLYKLLGIIKQLTVPGRNISDLRHDLDQYLKNTDVTDISKYKGLINHEFSRMISGRGQVDPQNYRRRFIELLELIFNSENLSGLYDGVDTDASRGERHSYLYQINKYREILNVAKELVEYNKLNCKQVVSQDQMEFDFKAEHGETTIETNHQLVSQKYQTFFKDYVDSIGDYLKGISSTLINILQIDTGFVDEVNTSYSDIETKLRTNLGDIARLEKELGNLKADIESNKRSLNLYDSYQKAAIKNKTGQDYQKDLRRFNGLVRAQSAEFNKKTSQLQTLKEIRDGYRTEMQILKNFRNVGKLDNILGNINKDIYDQLSKKILSTIANDLTFIYDDGKKFFTNPRVATGFVELFETPDDPTNPDKFDTILQKIDTGTSPFERPDSNTEVEDIKPTYMVGEILKSLENGFEVTATDTINALEDNIRPIITQVIVDYQRKRLQKDTQENMSNVGQRAAQFQEALLQKFAASIGEIFTNDASLNRQKITDTLHYEIFRNRFLSKVLNNFKRMFRKKTINKVIQFDQSISQLHPLITKLISRDKNCQYFKSFIIEYEMVEQLSRLKYIADTQKFLDGITNSPPRKLNDPMNRMQTVLYDYLGLKDNPVWILSKTDVYLSMPDNLSLTGTSLLSRIPKTELMDVCRIKATDYWNENKMGTVASFGSRKIKSIIDRIKKNDEDITKKQAEKVGLDSQKDKGKIKNIEGELKRLRTRGDKLEEELQKAKDEYKEKQGTYKPNAFLFGDSDAADVPLLNDKEREELIKNKENLNQRLLNLNPYDDKEIDELQKQQEEIDKNKQNDPMDFTEDKREKPYPDRADEEEQQQRNERDIEELRALLDQRLSERDRKEKERDEKRW